MLARLFVYKAISCPGSLGECEFTGNFSLGRLHCLGDRVASLRKSVSSYFGCCFGREPPTLRLSHCRVVSIHFLALSKPGQPHQMFPAITCRLRAPWGSPPNIWWSWAESNRRPARTHFSFQAAFRLPYDHDHCGSTKPMVKVFGRLSPTLKAGDQLLARPQIRQGSR